VNRGYDPREFTKVAFGGGGSLAAGFLARELGIKKVIIPKLSAVFSSWGMLMCHMINILNKLKIFYFPLLSAN
jgi:N-methylhydantoinase A